MPATLTRTPLVQQIAYLVDEGYSLDDIGQACKQVARADGRRFFYRVEEAPVDRVTLFPTTGAQHAKQLGVSID